MKYLFLVFLVIGHNIHCQIVQPGNLELNIYPGSEINVDNYDNSDNSKTVTTLNLFDDFQQGLICFSERRCYDDLNFNIDLLNNVLEIERPEDIVFINLALIHSVIDSVNKRTYIYETDLDNIPNFFARVFFDSDSVRIYKRYSVKKLQADYKPEFDTGSKTPTYEINEDFVILDEFNNVSSFNRVRRGVILRNLPENHLKRYLSENRYKLRTIEDLVELVDLIYSE